MRFIISLALLVLTITPAQARDAVAAASTPLKTKIVCQGKVSTLLHDGTRTRIFDANEVHTLVDAKPRSLTWNHSVCRKVAFTAPTMATPMVWDRSGFMGVDCSLPGQTTVWLLRYENAVVIKLGSGSKAHVFDQQGMLGTTKPRTGWIAAHCRPIGT